MSCRGERTYSSVRLIFLQILWVLKKLSGVVGGGELGAQNKQRRTQAGNTQNRQTTRDRSRCVVSAVAQTSVEKNQKAKHSNKPKVTKT